MIYVMDTWLSDLHKDCVSSWRVPKWCMYNNPWPAACVLVTGCFWSFWKEQWLNELMGSRLQFLCNTYSLYFLMLMAGYDIWTINLQWISPLLDYVSEHWGNESFTWWLVTNQPGFSYFCSNLLYILYF